MNKGIVLRDLLVEKERKKRHIHLNKGIVLGDLLVKKERKKNEKKEKKIVLSHNNFSTISFIYM
jgi:hypothetical protein